MKTSYITRVAMALALTAAFSSCHIYKKYETPTSTALTKAYAEAREMPADSAAFGNLLWEDVFTDPMLASLIKQALVNNNDLRNAQLNVDIARANLRGARLSYLPSLALSPNGAGASYAGSDLSWTYTLPAQLSWEIDIFGKILNSKRGAQAALYRSEAYAQAVRSQIISAVASTYYSIAAVHSQLALSRTTSELWKETVNTMRDLKEAGRGVTEAAVVQSSANYYSILGSITDLESSLDKLNNTMSLLLNTMPQEWAVADKVDLQVPQLIRAGVPMVELACRPDVQAAEQSLAAAYYSTNSARAAFYPGLTIMANGGFTNLLGSMIKNPGEWFINLAGQLTAPLFARGQNIARLKATKAQQQQAMNNFQYALMSASAEVSNALTAYHNTSAKLQQLATQADYMARAVDITDTLFTNAASSYPTTYLEVLTAQQNYLSVQMNFINCNLIRTSAIINLYQALGGGR